MSLTLYYYLHKQIQTQEICPQTFESATLVKIKVSKGFFFLLFALTKEKLGSSKETVFLSVKREL